jgi:hypothetical protein
VGLLDDVAEVLIREEELADRIADGRSVETTKARPRSLSAS